MWVSLLSGAVGGASCHVWFVTLALNEFAPQLLFHSWQMVVVKQDVCPADTGWWRPCLLCVCLWRRQVQREFPGLSETTWYLFNEHTTHILIPLYPIESHFLCECHHNTTRLNEGLYFQFIFNHLWAVLYSVDDLLGVPTITTSSFHSCACLLCRTTPSNSYIETLVPVEDSVCFTAHDKQFL